MSATQEQESAYRDALQQTDWVRGVLKALLESRHEQTAVIVTAMKGRELLELFNIGDQEPIKSARDRITVLDQTIAKLTDFGEHYAGIIAGYEYERIVDRADGQRPTERARSSRVLREPKPVRQTYRPSPSPKPKTVRLHSEQADVSLPADVVEVDRIPSTGMALLVDEIQSRAAFAEHWAPWARRRWGVSRRYEGFRRMRERA